MTTPRKPTESVHAQHVGQGRVWIEQINPDKTVHIRYDCADSPAAASLQYP